MLLGGRGGHPIIRKCPVSSSSVLMARELDTYQSMFHNSLPKHMQGYWWISRCLGQKLVWGATHSMDSNVLCSIYVLGLYILVTACIIMYWYVFDILKIFNLQGRHACLRILSGHVYHQGYYDNLNPPSSWNQSGLGQEHAKKKKQLTARLHALCRSVVVKHTILVSFINQSIVLCISLLGICDTLNKPVSGSACHYINL